MTNPHQKITPTEAAKLLGKAESTLASERSRGVGCPYLKINGKVRYLRSDVEAYAAKNTTRHDTSGVRV
ncbi:helix-turn-helix domain-containing protein [Chitinibacter bivalviorum]|uniref:Helix-turn-helix domain-containing protein n=1 Tax=Chitinibacter bivalviorum TaxID=2739434 RepID=A0A7H9BEB2_9NEIS|nr:helix-turn-helix domain-containing protein [Chitinibacter bivalviorum]QLG87070.1 helix-turn-helix domain-containing protein [Chitinibacter bivalviorum]